MKLLSVVVPCYNSAAYMENCLKTLVPGGEEMDILIVDDGSKDETGAIADRWQKEYPSIIRVIHQPNGGHGSGLNQGVRTALGKYFKVVDSDDRLDPQALTALLSVLREHPDDIDLIVNDYVYDQANRPAAFRVSYESVMKPGAIQTWEEMRPFPVYKQFMIHSMAYRTALLREMKLVLPEHCFYEDNVYIYRPLPFVKRVYYLNMSLYGYFVGRGDQSINEKVILTRIDQSTRMAEEMTCSHPYSTLLALPKNLRKYMLSSAASMLSTTAALQYIVNTEESLALYRRMWNTLRDYDKPLYNALRRNPLAAVSRLPGKLGRRTVVSGYRFIRRKMSLE